MGFNSVKGNKCLVSDLIIPVNSKEIKPCLR